MALSFNHATRRVAVPQADAQPVLIQTLINAIRTEEASERGIVEPQIADAAGKYDLGNATATGITVNLLSTWMLEFAAGAYQATVTGGNLSNALARISNTGSPQVLVLSSAAATLIETGTSGLTPEESELLSGISDTLAAGAEVDVRYVNGIAIVGTGGDMDPWGPA